MSLNNPNGKEQYRDKSRAIQTELDQDTARTQLLSLERKPFRTTPRSEEVWKNGVVCKNFSYNGLLSSKSSLDEPQINKKMMMAGKLALSPFGSCSSPREGTYIIISDHVHEPTASCLLDRSMTGIMLATV
ncbi:hypothetical protein L3X38_028384 [Prunus dulcis]|uniref:Uncharacterized protein n=1 Tax=Prunus dulcis TaxID=3755 RepID=A0AAD4Z0D5_PRUDU|nr:hypothetical protein L3X38_028384 [Prunus dulcis]